MRLDIDTFREIGDALVRNKSRSFLTGFGIFWGLFMLLSMLGGGQGLKALLKENFEGFATNSFFIYSQPTTKPYKGFKEQRYWEMTTEDVDRIKRMIPEIDVVTPTIAQWRQKAVNGDKDVNCTIKGVYADYKKIEEPSMKYGRYINETDILMERKVCVIGKRIYNSLFPEGGDPCGTFIKIGPTFFRVIGVDFSSGNISIQGRSDQTALIPINIAQKLFNSGQRVDVICMVGKSGVRMETIENRMRQVVARAHFIDPTDKQAIGIFNAEEIFSIVDNLFRGLNILIWLIGFGTLLAGAIGVSNIMMVTVKERTIEIGIRRAIGATPKDILSQIMMESVTLTLISGCAGIMFTVFVLNILEVASGNPVFQITFWTAIAAAALLSLLGVAAGLAPAARAMKIKPVDAMRDE